MERMRFEVLLEPPALLIYAQAFVMQLEIQIIHNEMKFKEIFLTTLSLQHDL